MRCLAPHIKPSNMVTVALLALVLFAPLPVAKSQSDGEAPTGSIPVPSINAYTLSEDPAVTEAEPEIAIDDVGDMSAVERVQLRVLNYPELSGEFAIDSNHMLSLPGVGRVNVEGKPSSRIERELENKISIYARRDVKVSIEIVKYRNYFIMGMITQPGANEWQPGLNIIKAVALAGGTVRQPSAVDDPVAALSLQQSKTQLQFSLALLARLKAERDGSEKVQIGEQLSSVLADMPLSVRPRLQDFVDRQSEVLDEQRKLTLTQIAGLEQELEAAQAELDAAIEQEKAIKAQFEISSSLLKDVEQLKDKQLVSNTRYLEQRSDLITSQIRHAEAQSLTERARARVANISRQIETLRAQQRVALNDRIEVLQREVAQLELSLLQSSPNSQTANGANRLSYNIARQTPTGIVTFAANVFSEIQPGDVIVVSAGGQENEMSANGEAPESEISNAAGIMQRAIEASSAAQTLSGRAVAGSVVR